MEAIYSTVGMITVWIGGSLLAIAAAWLAYIYAVGFVRSVRFIVWLDRNARIDPAVGMTLWEKFRGVFLKCHEMTVFRPGKDSIVLSNGKTFFG